MFYIARQSFFFAAKSPRGTRRLIVLMITIIFFEEDWSFF